MKKVLSFMLLLGVPMLTPVPLVTMVQSASAAEAVYLGAGQSTTFPTWAFGRSTRLCAQASGGETEVGVNAGNAEEALSVGGGQKVCIDRNWHGMVIGVTNQGSQQVGVSSQLPSCTSNAPSIALPGGLSTWGIGCISSR